jgi:hypothetical protein
MRVYVLILFLTLVLTHSVSHSAPTIDHTPLPIDVSPKNATDVYSFEEKDPAKDWSLRLGFLGGTINETHQAEQIYYYGLRYDFLRDPFSACEGEVTIGKNNFVHIVIGKKMYFTLEEVTLPYYKLALGDLIDSMEGLGSIFNIKKIQAIAAVGLDDLFKWNRHLQGEIGIGYAVIGPQLEISLGIAF